MKIARLSNPLKMDTVYRCFCDTCGKDRGYKRKVDANRSCSSCVAKQRVISEETKVRISDSIKKLPPISKESRLKAGLKLKGRKVSLETKKKLSCIKRSIPIDQFDDFLNPINKRDRDLIYKSGLSKSIYERDNFSCQVCYKNGKLVAHHKNGFDLFPQERFDVNNIITLCNNCHQKFHKKFGYKNNTKDQFQLFLSEVVSANSSLT